MKKKQKKYIFGIIFLILTAIVLSVFFYLRREYNTEISSLPGSSVIGVSDDATGANEIAANERHFFFRMSERRLIQERFNYFPKKLIKRNNFPKNWKIYNFLNYFFRDWKKHYNISEKNLREPIKKNNYIYFRPKKRILLKKNRQSFTMSDLEKLNIFSSYLKNSETDLSGLIEVIHEEENDWSDIEKYIKNNFKEQKATSVIRKIRDSILLF